MMNQSEIDAETDTLELYEGDTIFGVVVSKTTFGVFVNFGAKKDGLLHRNQLRGNSRQLRNERYESLEIGDEIVADLCCIEQDGNRIDLSEKAVHDDLVYSLLPRNEPVEGVVANVESYGVFVRLPEYYASGLLRASKSFRNRMDRTDFLDSLARGDRITVFVDDVLWEDDLKIELLSNTG